MHLSEILSKVGDVLPFMQAAVATAVPTKVNVTRLVEAVMIAGLTAGATAYGTVHVLEERVTQMQVALSQQRLNRDREIAQVVRRIDGMELIEQRHYEATQSDLKQILQVVRPAKQDRR